MLHRIVMCAVLAFVCPASAQTLLDKAGRDEVVEVSPDDAVMAAAIRRARSELDAFLALAEAPPADRRNFSVKVGLPLSNGHHEYIWIRPFRRDGNKFVGTVVNRPVNFRNLASGDRLAFERKDIADWSYLQGDRMKGNYTGCALLKNEPAQQRDAFMKQYGMDCAD